MTLNEYRRKRDFQKSPEPTGGHSTQGRAKFVIQKHDATRLHYDFRLEADGVLKSWAVPKGPSLDPAQKRLAVEVEDHPLDYGTFEGVIPSGEYGAGPVLVWDRGTWQLDKQQPFDRAYRAGKIEFELDGERLHGRWVLVRTHGSGGHATKKPSWLLIKRHDDFARSGEAEIVEDQVISVSSGRSLEEIAAGKNGAKSPKSKRAKSSTGGSARGKAISALPKTLEPELATLAEHAPDGEDWAHEIKFDGYRMLCFVEQGGVRLVSRNGLDWTARFPALARSLERLPVQNAVLDGEVVMLDERGVSHFQALQEALSKKQTDGAEYYVFDVLHLDGQSLLDEPLRQRKDRLSAMLDAWKNRPTKVKLSEHIVGGGPTFFEEACRLGLEGIISKRLESRYRSGRGRDWLKIKGAKQEPFLIVGYTRPTGRRTALGALLLGRFDAKKLVYAGKVGTGFGEKTLEDLQKKLRPLTSSECPLDSKPAGLSSRAVTWVLPKLTCQVGFAGWTRDGLLRQARFLGLRADRSPKDLKNDAPENQVMPPTRTKRPTSTELPPNTRLTHPERVVFQAAGVTKLDLARYYTQIADWILPHVAGRPLSIVRCPSGSSGPRFFQRHAAAGIPNQVRSVDVPGEAEPYMMVEDLGGLLALVQISALELHVWGSRAEKLDRPDRLVFDLDPAEDVPWEKVIFAAREVRERLADLGLDSFLKTTGGKGLHVVVPIARTLDWKTAKEFTRSLAALMAAESPERYVIKVAKAARVGKILIDYLRNDQGSTSVAAYSTRARPDATVSVPIDFQELAKVKSDQYTVQNLPVRLQALKKDPWKDLLTSKQKITKGMMEIVKRKTI